ncbi:hypothetical protein INT45_000238 [Circinella minor]|uniref:Tc1-like transposase DDE domain-containing protein n=1 Tax=Circinella minor TaxID=1195481 RepID=A0A8H7VLT9_9FUNG|nr:hypothetical protein INT45_000238 [Circinella minor]
MTQFTYKVDAQVCLGSSIWKIRPIFKSIARFYFAWPNSISSAFDFDDRCVFIDEAGFNLHIRRNFGRSKRGSPARAVIPSQRGVSITILGAICELGVINVSVRKPQAVQSSKKRKRNDGTTVLNARIGTRTEHFVEFLDKVMDILDENNMKGRYLVMDNAPIHTNKSIGCLVEQRG